MTVQVGKALLQSFGMWLLDILQGHSAMHLQSLCGGHKDSKRWLQTTLAALDIIEFLCSQVGTESCLGHHIISIGKCHSGGEYAVASMCDIGKGTAVNDGWSLLGGLDQIGLKSILQEYAYGSCHTHVLHSEWCTIGLEAQQDILHSPAEVFLSCGQTQDGHYLAGRCNVESALHHHSVGLGTQSCHYATQITVVDIQHSLPQHFAQGESFITVLIDIVVQQGGYHIVSRGDGMEITCKVQVYLIHREHLCITASSGTTLHAEAGTQRGLTQGHHSLLADAVQSQCQAYAHGSLSYSCLGGCDGSDQYQLMLSCLMLIYQFQGKLGCISAIGLNDLC